MKKASIFPAIAGKHAGDENHLVGDETHLVGDENHLVGDENHLLHVFFIHTPEK
ncbi:MAG: hypothetical protein LBP64_08770 [Tannerella sp.]|jgi:hypothetical protein|nr:hypothetical protein [Tannerella sp.]